MRYAFKMARALAMNDTGDRYEFSPEDLKAFEDLVRADEREVIAADADWCIQNYLEHLIPERVRSKVKT
jgi:rRNA maturation endonuclease Nob1